MDLQTIADLISQYGFPIVAASGGAYMIYYVWRWATQEMEPVISETNSKLIELIDHIRTLDNDLIRLNQKLSVLLQMREQCKKEQDKQ